MPKIDDVKFKEKIEEIDGLIEKKQFFKAMIKCKATAFNLMCGCDRRDESGYLCFISTMKVMEVEQREQLIAILIRLAKMDLFCHKDYGVAKKYLIAILYMNCLTLNSDPILKPDGINRSDKVKETVILSALLSIAEGEDIISLENEVEKIKSIFS